jgi:lipopolysaccharide transport system permease protein
MKRSLQVGAGSAPFRLIIDRLWLLLRIARSDLRLRHAGAVIGTGWLVLYPILLIGSYSLVYLLILRVRPVGMSAETYVVYLMSGLAPFLASAEAITLSAGSVSANRTLLSNSVFPVELAPVKAVLLAQPAQFVALAACGVAALLVEGFSWAWLMLPVVWFLHLLMLIGLGWFLALATLVLRDIQALLPILIMLLYVVSPIAYTPEMVPARLQPILWANPLAPFVVSYQRILALGALPTAGQLAAMVGLSAIAFFGGSWIFQRAKSVAMDHA